MVKHEGRCKLAKTIARDAINYVEEFHQNNVHNDTNCRAGGQNRTTWCPSKRGWFKVNVDEAVFKEAGQCEVGVVIRNEKGELMSAMCKKIPFPLGALEAEARSAKEGITLARDLELREVMVEGDASIVMSALVNPNNSPCSIQKIMEGARMSLKAFRMWETNHVEDTPRMIVDQICMDVLSIGPNPINEFGYGLIIIKKKKAILTIDYCGHQPLGMGV